MQECNLSDLEKALNRAVELLDEQENWLNDVSVAAENNLGSEGSRAFVDRLSAYRERVVQAGAVEVDKSVVHLLIDTTKKLKDIAEFKSLLPDIPESKEVGMNFLSSSRGLKYGLAQCDNQDVCNPLS